MAPLSMWEFNTPAKGMDPEKDGRHPHEKFSGEGEEEGYGDEF